jgi:ribokinase
MAASVPVLAVTRGSQGADIYAEGNVTSIPAPEVKEVDSTGAGDIFSAVFFTQLSHFGDPIHAAEMAVQIASDSVIRVGLAGAPTEDILYQLSKEVQ